MKIFKKFIVILMAINSLNAFAQSTEEKLLLNDTQYLRSIPPIQDFIDSILHPSREDLRNKPGNTQSA